MIDILSEDIPLVPGFPKEEWIPADKHLPQAGGIYLCVVETMDELFGLQKDVHCCYFNHNIQKFYWDRMESKITFWIPIPKIPK